MLHIKPLAVWERFLDKAMVPIMYCVSGTFSEHPQMTHHWNNHHLERESVSFLRARMMVNCKGRKNQKIRSNTGILFHIPIIGGWKKYVVLEAIDSTTEKYHVGWINEQVCGVSRIPVKGRVRLLVGPCDVQFFGIDPITGQQVALQKVGQGIIGRGGPHCQLPLL